MQSVPKEQQAPVEKAPVPVMPEPIKEELEINQLQDFKPVEIPVESQTMDAEAQEESNI